MAWQTIPGVTGRIYVPDQVIHDGKHPCADCFACQHCSRERCAVCRGSKAAGRPKGDSDQDPIFSKKT